MLSCHNMITILMMKPMNECARAAAILLSSQEGWWEKWGGGNSFLTPRQPKTAKTAQGMQ